MRSAAADPRGPAAAIEPRRLPAARWPGRRSLPRPERRGGGIAAPDPYPSAAPPPPGPGPPPSGQRSPPSASDCFGSNGNGGGASRPGSRHLLGFGGPPRPFVVLLLPLAGPGAPPAALARASPFGARASPPRSGVSSARPAPGCPRPACGPVYGPLTMSLKPQQQQQQQQQPPAVANARKPGGGGLLTSPAAAPSSPSVSSSSAAASSSSVAASAGGGRPGLGRWVSRPSPLRSGLGPARALHPLPRVPHGRPRPVTGRASEVGGRGARGPAVGVGLPARVWSPGGWVGGAAGFLWECQAVSSLLQHSTPSPERSRWKDWAASPSPFKRLGAVHRSRQLSAPVPPSLCLLRPTCGDAWAAPPPSA